MRQYIHIILALLISTHINAQIDSINVIQNQAIEAAKLNLFDDAYKHYNKLITYSTKHSDYAYLIETSLCNYIIVNLVARSEVDSAHVVKHCSETHDLIYQSYKSNKYLSNEERLCRIIRLHESFAGIFRRIDQLDLAGKMCDLAYEDYYTYVDEYHTEVSDALNVLAYVEENYYGNYLNAFALRVEAFIIPPKQPVPSNSTATGVIFASPLVESAKKLFILPETTEQTKLPAGKAIIGSIFISKTGR